jgi:hypothetical protein
MDRKREGVNMKSPWAGQHTPSMKKYHKQKAHDVGWPLALVIIINTVGKCLLSH